MPMYNPPIGRRTRAVRRGLVRAARRFSPYSRAASGAAIAAQALSLGRRVYKNMSRKRKTRSYVEQRPRKKARTTPSIAPGGRKAPTRLRMAARLTKFSKMKPAAVKVPKSAIASYKEYGTLQAEKLMYISHDHRGSIDKFWSGVSYGLTKLLCAKAGIYPAKSLQQPMIGPRTNSLSHRITYDDAGAHVLVLVFCIQAANGNITRGINELSVRLDVPLQTPDQYKTFQTFAQEIENVLKARYGLQANAEKVWLQEAQWVVNQSPPTNAPTPAIIGSPIYIQNLDDAEIHLYAHSMVKLQNITEGDGGSNLTQALDANPLIGRMYQAKGHRPNVDGDVITMLAGGFTANALDDFFGDVEPSGFTLHGNSTRDFGQGWPDGQQGDADNLLGVISHIPTARELYGNQTVKTGTVYIKPGGHKELKTSFSFKKTFRELGNMGKDQYFQPDFGSHTMIGLKCEHRDGKSTLKVGYNRDTQVGCYIKHTRTVHPLKTAFTTFKDQTVDPLLSPTEAAEP